MKNIRENRDDRKQKDEIRRRRAHTLAAPLADVWFRYTLDYTHDDFHPEDIDGPVVVCFNHSCAYDPIFIGVLFRKKMLSYIASEHILRNRTWGKLLDRYINIIPHSKGARTNRTALTAIKRARKGESVFLAHEGEQTWDGVSMSVMPYTGKLVKSSGATLVTYRIEGAYLTKPRWSLADRKGKIRGHIVGIYGPEQLKAMSEAEIEEVIVRDTYFDVWEWQKSQPGGPQHYRPKKGGSADGLERAVFSCPSCGKIGTLASSGDEVSCTCGFRIRMEDTGFLSQPAPFETIAEWMRFDRERLGTVLRAAEESGEDREIFSDGGIRLIRINDDHSDEEIAKGRLNLRYRDGGFVIGLNEHRCRVEDIFDMKMVLAGRILFSTKEGYYELLSDKEDRSNLYKYLIAAEFIKKSGE